MTRFPPLDSANVPEFFATIHPALGSDYTKNLYEGDRSVPITDGDKPIGALISVGVNPVARGPRSTRSTQRMV